jgi:hypothetical protein
MDEPNTRRGARAARLWAPVAMLLVAMLLATAATTGLGCGKKKENVDPKATFAASITAMKALKSLHVTYEVKKPANAKPVQGLDIVGLTGDLTADGKMQATIDVQQNGIPLQIDFIAVPPTQYLKDPVSGKWQSVPAALSPVGELNVSAGVAQILDRVTGATYVGTEDRNGVKTYHFRGGVKGADVAGIVRAVDPTASFAVDLWIGVDDHYVHSVEMVGAATAGEDPKTVRSIELSKFDETVDIQPPK